MAWGRNRNRQQNVRDYARDSVMTEARKIMDNRTFLLSPFPYKPIEVYKAAFPKEVFVAMRALAKHCPTMLYRETSLDVRIHKASGEAMKLRIPLGRELPMHGNIPDTGDYRQKRDARRNIKGEPNIMHSFPEEMRNELCQWVMTRERVERESNLAMLKLSALFDVCRTMGQIKRLWPNAAYLLPKRGQDQLAEAKVRSPYPNGALEGEGSDDGESTKWVLKEEWRPEVLAPIDETLSSALLLQVDREVFDGALTNYPHFTDYT